jgi:hypothetical protein
MAFDNNKMAWCLASHLNTRDKSIFLTQIIDKQDDKRNSCKIAGTIFKFINKGER